MTHIRVAPGRWASLVVLVGLLALVGCPKNKDTDTSGEQKATTWVVFDVVEKGSGNTIKTYVWVDGHQEDFETVQGTESDARFEGFGKTGAGYVVPFSPNQKVRFHAWSEGHEMVTIDAKIRRGENVIAVQLRKTEVDDERVPDVIRTDVDTYQPTEDVKTGLTSNRLSQAACALPLLFAVLVVAGCKGGAGRTAHAGDCWGQGVVAGADCADSVSTRAAAAGAGTTQRQELFQPGDCGAPVDCDGVASMAPTTAEDGGTSGTTTHHGGNTGGGSHGTTGSDATPTPGSDAGTGDASTGGDTGSSGSSGSSGSNDGSMEPVAILTPTGHGASSGGTSCEGVDIAAVDKRGMPYSEKELACFRDVALALEPMEVRDFTNIQIAVIGLYNARDAKWQQGVERALAFWELQNTPQINFAGIKPAYDQGRYAMVVHRANVVWNNLDKGYRLTQEHKTFVAEFACRSGVQLHLQGTVSDDHERWCRIWVERLEHEGGDVTEARNLLDQVE